MTYGWYSEGWWEEIGNDINNRFVVDTDNCTLDEMQQVIYRSLSFHHFPLPTEEENDSPTDVNYVCNLLTGCIIYVLCVFILNRHLMNFGWNIEAYWISLVTPGMSLSHKQDMFMMQCG